MEITERGIPRKCDNQQLKNKRLHEKDEPVTSILMSIEVEVGPRVKSIAEAYAYRTEGKSLVVLQVKCRSVYNKAILAMLKSSGLILQLSEGIRLPVVV